MSESTDKSPSQRLKLRSATGFAILALFAAACGADTTESQAAPTTSEAPLALADADSEAMGDEAMEDEAMEDEAMEDDAMEDVEHDLNLASTDLGNILTDEGGYTVYLFTNDEQDAGTSACEGDCIAAWPVVGAVSYTHLTLPTKA